MIFLGTPDFAVPTLTRLASDQHEIAYVVSQPDRPRGRGRKNSPSPVAQFALDHGFPLLRPESVNDPSVIATLRAATPDLGIVVAFGQFLPKAVRELPRCGYMINGHASLLPKYRGAAPIQHALLHGETETGVSIMRVEKAMDAGAVAFTQRLAILPEENAEELSTRLSVACATAIAEAVQRIANRQIVWQEQDATQASFAPKIEKADAVLDWQRPARELVHQIRGLAPKPGAVTDWQGEPLRILGARALEGDVALAPGTLHYENQQLRIATASGWLVPTVLQRAGGNAMPTEAFLRGHTLPEDGRLGERSDAPHASSRIAP